MCGLQAVRARRGGHRAGQDLPSELFRVRTLQDHVRLRREGDLHEEPMRLHALHRAGEGACEIAGQRGGREEGRKESRQKGKERKTADEVHLTTVVQQEVGRQARAGEDKQG